MCPACLATLAYILVGAGSVGGLVFLGLKGGVKSRRKPAGPALPLAPLVRTARSCCNAKPPRPSLW
ncbi:MAG: hypothetical protein E6Q98_23825 [Rhodospirillaceae bacterium]|nr:MAG: hypothetical protein E6Q98_23825 [Rhodospirillaceae bacterium]